MKKLLFLIDGLGVGGVETVLIELLNRLDPSYFSIDVLVMGSRNELEHRLAQHIHVRHAYKKPPAEARSPIIRYAYGVGKSLVPKWWIRRFIIRQDYDAVIDFKGINTNVLLAAKCRKVLWSHKDASLKTNPVERDYVEKYGKKLNERFKAWCYAQALRKCDDIVCISDTLKAHFIERYGYENKITVLNNVINDERIRTMALKNVTIPGLQEQLFSFCCVSRITHGKGIERMVAAADRLWQAGFSFQLLVVGGGDRYASCKELEKQRQGKLLFVGNQQNPYAFLRQCDAFVCPSETEAYPTVLCEALILGKPVIMTDVGSVKDILDGSRFGCIVESSEEGIYEGMKRFLESPETVESYGIAAKERSAYFETGRSVAAVEAFLKAK